MSEINHKDGSILGVSVSSITKEGVLSFVIDSLKSKSKFFISTPNPEMIVLAQKDKTFLKALNTSDMAIPDGVGLLWGSKFLNIGLKLTRIQGRDMFLTLLTLANKRKSKVYLLGASEEVNSAAVLKINSNYKNINIKGSSGFRVDRDGKPVRKSDINIQRDILNSINKFKPSILFVAFGHPKQEKWIVDNLKKLQVGGAMAIGGTLDYFVGTSALPPMWMERIGLEWLWRLLREPWRVKRIFDAVILFPILILRAKLSSSKI